MSAAPKISPSHFSRAGWRPAAEPDRQHAMHAGAPTCDEPPLSAMPAPVEPSCDTAPIVVALTGKQRLALALAKLTHGQRGTQTLLSGDILAERYAIVGKLGAGAMGVVYEALRLSDGTPVAAKLFRGGTSPEALARFLREAEIAARLRHPNVVAVLDVDVTIHCREFRDRV